MEHFQESIGDKAQSHHIEDSLVKHEAVLSSGLMAQAMDAIAFDWRTLEGIELQLINDLSSTLLHMDFLGSTWQTLVVFVACGLDIRVEQWKTLYKWSHPQDHIFDHM